MFVGDVIEMVIGEGKIFVGVIVVVGYVLVGWYVYVVMINDYLVCCDVEWMGLLLDVMGLMVGWIIVDLIFDECWIVYDCDVIYVLVNEIGFDVLCD